MILDPKFKAGEKVWCAVRFSQFNHDDRLPVAEVVIESVRFSGVFYGAGCEENKQNFDYGCTEVDGWRDISLGEGELFRTKEEAEQSAIEGLKASLDKNAESRMKIEKMLQSAR